MNNRRKLIVALGASALSSPLMLYAQPQSKVWHIGYIDFGSRQSMIDAGRYAALADGLRERGYVEGKNLVLEARFAEGNADRLAVFAAELVRQKVDLIMTQGTPASHAAKRATTSTPIVVVVTADPVADGLAASLARPGGNITGMSSGAEDILQKLPEMLSVAVPKLKRAAVITASANSTHASFLLRIQAATRKAGIDILPVSVRTPEDIERGFATIARERCGGVIILLDGFFFQQRKQFAELSLKFKLPSIFPNSVYPEVGGLMSYGVDSNDNFRRAGIFVDKILKGAKPGDIPFEQPTRYYLVINRKTANALGIKVNNELLARADRVIE